MEPGWHTYWANPGASGVPLHVTWTLPDGFVAHPIEWPAPQRLSDPAGVSYGFERELVVLARIDPPATGAPKHAWIGAAVDWQTCADVCVPESATIGLLLDGDSKTAAANGDSIITAARSRFPRPSLPVGWTPYTSIDAGAIMLRMLGASESEMIAPYFFPDSSGVIDPDSPQSVSHTGGQVTVTLARARVLPRDVDRLSGVLVVNVADEHSLGFHMDVPVTRDAEPVTAPEEEQPRRIIPDRFLARRGTPGTVAAPRGPVPVDGWSEIAATGHRKGAASGAITIVEFSDFQCPYCRFFEMRVLPALMRQFPTEVAVVFRHSPLDIHPLAAGAARASECAAAAGRFWEFHDLLFAQQEALGRKTYAAFARESGITDLNSFERCAAATGPVSAIEADLAAAARVGVVATPTVLMNGMRYPGTPDSAVLTRAIRAILKRPLVPE